MTLEITNKIHGSRSIERVRINGRKQWDPWRVAATSSGSPEERASSSGSSGGDEKSGGGDLARERLFSHSIARDWLSRQLRQFRVLLSVSSQPEKVRVHTREEN